MTTRPLDASTWDAFARLLERNNGIFGGCWCMGYHPEGGQKGINRRAVKQERVATGSHVETAYLMRSPANARRLLDAMERLEGGGGEAHDFIETN